MDIQEVKTSRQWKDFLNLPDQIYKPDYPRYVRPLNLHLEMMTGKRNAPNKYFFIAYKDGQPFSRIAFKVHKHGKKTHLNFGFFESRQGHDEIPIEMIKKGLALHSDLKIMGPFHFRMEDPYVGMLVEGFDKDPYFLMPYNPPYYDSILQKAGLKVAMDLYTYELDAHTAVTNSPIIKENSIKAKEKGVSVRFLNKNKLNQEARTIARIFNDALSQNWGFEEFLDEQVKEMVMLFKLFIDPRVVAIAQVENKDVGCLLMIPNYNPIIKSSNGKITPSLIWNYFMKRNNLSQIRGYALGVLKDYHSMGIGSALTQAMFDQAPPLGYTNCEISWILSNNGPMNELSKAMGGKHNKVYRIYELSREPSNKDQL